MAPGLCDPLSHPLQIHAVLRGGDPRAVPEQHKVHAELDRIRLFGGGDADGVALLADCSSHLLLLLGRGTGLVT